MISRVKRLSVVLLIGVFATCSPVTESDNDNDLDFLEKTTKSFVFVYTRSDAPTIDALAASMEAQLARLQTKLQVDSLPRVTVVLYPTRAAFQEANETAFWVPAVSSRSRIEMISPYAPNQVFELWPDTRAEHMLAHVVSFAINREAGNNPRWLWESLALYESGQKTTASAVEFFKPGETPSLSQLNGGYGTPIFDVGYYLGEFLETTWGVQGIIDLIEAEGDLPQVLGLTGQQFINQFVAFVRQKYNLPSE